MTSQVFYGQNIYWGLGPTTASISGVTAIYQSLDHELKNDEWTGRDQRGNVCAYAGYNPYEELTIEYLVSDAQSAAGNAGITYVDRGTKFTFNADGPLTGSWICQSTSQRRTNTDAMKISNKCIRYAGIA